jgi:ribosomal protein S12 methylthiotransferase accessory factor
VIDEGTAPPGTRWRERPAAQTLRLAQAQMLRLGISRVTDITRMDRLGLPVFASVRPRSLLLRVNAGKGLSALEARVGALMEAVEHAVAEPQRSAWTPVPMRLTDIASGFSGRFELQDLAPRHGVSATGSPFVSALHCEDLLGGDRLPLPAALVFVPYGGDIAAQLFGWSATGLASGNSPEEATLHALLEILERDAVAMNQARDASLWLEHAELPEPFAAWAEAWRRMGIDLAVRWLPNILDLPCFEVHLHEEGGSRVDLAAGSGLHPEPAAALARAIAEAAQSRLSHIHGGRDDITGFYQGHDTLGADRRAHMQAGLRSRLFDRQRRVRWSDLPAQGLEGQTPAEALQALLARLAQAGFGTVLRHRFDFHLGGLHVVKVLVPRCENLEADPTRIGPRLLDRIVGRG